MPSHTPEEIQRRRNERRAAVRSAVRTAPSANVAARSGMSAKQAGAIQAPHNSPAMSSFPEQGPKGLMKGTNSRR